MKPSSFVRSLLPFLLLSLALASASCNQEEYTRVNLNNKFPQEPVAGLIKSATGPRGQPLRVGIAGVISPAMTLESYNDLLQYLGKKLDRPVELLQRPSYNEVNELVRNKEVELAFVCSLAYVEAKADFGMELLVVPQVRRESTYYSYLIVPADSRAASLADLKGKVFAFSDPLSNSGRLAPTYQLSLMNKKPETYFRNYIFTYNHDYSIQAVADKLVDGAAVDGLIYDYFKTINSPTVKKTRVVSSWGPYGIPPVVVNPGLDAPLKDDLKTLFLNIDSDDEGRSILDSLMIDRFVPASDAAYDSVREMRARVAKAK